MLKLINGDCLEEMKSLPENSVDAIVTDPPYGLEFMGKDWDKGVPGVEFWVEMLRVLKPGGHLLSFSGTRTYHRMASAIEDAGFEVRDMIEWVYGSGFPKSRNVGLDVDKRNGVTKNRGKAFVVAGQSGQKDKDTGGDLVPGSNTIGAYVAQNEWSGWGTALKPAHEPICMARKPLQEKTVAKNVLKYGTGGINIDESRVEFGDETDSRVGTTDKQTGAMGKAAFGEKTGKDVSISTYKEGGRFPANLIHDNSEEVRECFPETKGGGSQNGSRKWKGEDGEGGFGGWAGKVSTDHYISRDDGTGNASRFFKSIIYQAKASKSERNKGCEELEENDFAGGSIKHNNLQARCSECGDRHYDCNGQCSCGKNDWQRRETKNNHPTVKPIALMEYLIKMVTPNGGVVLDPFMGSGSTGVACKNLNCSFIGIELDPSYIEIAKKRIE